MDDQKALGANIGRKLIGGLCIGLGGYLGRDLPSASFFLVMFGSVIWGWTLRDERRED